MPSEDHRIIYLEDDDLTRKIFRKYFSNPESVTTVKDTEIFLELISKTIYHLIFLDINLGSDSSGAEILERIREITDFKQCKIIAITAYALNGDREFYLSKGFDDYLPKPYNMEQLHKIIDKYLSK